MYYAKASVRQVRDDYLKDGAAKVRIKRNGEVHVCGPMPNATHISGWYFAGMVENLQDELGYARWANQTEER